jgi:tRNA-specific 2-thiouridylase
LRGADPTKDKSYFLHRVSTEALSHTLFPIGHLTKQEVRILAEKRGLVTAQKPDSQGIYFVGKIDFHDFLRKRLAPRSGDIVTADGKVVGRHDGLDGYTIGQRQGMGVSKDRHAWYVAAKDEKKNQLIVVPDREDPLLYHSAFDVISMHWCAGKPMEDLVSKETMVEVRYHTKPVACQMIMLDPSFYHPRACENSSNLVDLRMDSRFHGNDTKHNVSVHIMTAEPIWGLAPGQSAVFYQENECLGGGFIRYSQKNEKHVL